MVKLVAVYQGGTKSGPVECKARRYLPLEIETDLTMVMALDEFCLACGNGSQSKVKQADDIQTFKRKYASLDKDELSAALMLTWNDMLPSLAQTVSCVGCRRSIEHLFQTMKESSDDCSIDPLVITKDGIISITKEHINNPSSLANLLIDQISRLYRRYNEGPASKKSGAKKGGRCAHHTIEQKKGLSGSWLECWDVMEDECKDEVVLLPFSAIRAVLDKYLKRHSFCCECSTMINKAFTYLIEEGKDPANVDENGDELEMDEDDDSEDEDRPLECDEQEDHEEVNEDGSLNLFSGVSPCVTDEHVHITRNPKFISQLLLLAEPDLSGLDQERHAKNMETAQKEVLTCIGITLFNRFHKIQQKLREGEQTCDLLCLVALTSLRKSFDICVERKRGILDLDTLCFQIEQSDRDRERKQARKREKKTNNKQKKRDLKQAALEIQIDESQDTTPAICDHDKVLEAKSENCDEIKKKNETKEQNKKLKNKKTKSKQKKKDPVKKSKQHPTGASCGADAASCGANAASCDEHGGADSDSGLSCVWSGDTSPLYARCEGRYEHGTWIKGGSPDLGLGEGELVKHVCTVSKPELGLLSSLEEQLLEEEETEEGVFISQEEMREFQSMFPQLNTQREQLRENLREKFEALCVNGGNIGGKIGANNGPRAN